MTASSAPCRLVIKGKVFHGSRDDRRVAITFDEHLGPNTRPLLRILDRHDVKATFFQLGREVEEHPQLALEIVA